MANKTIYVRQEHEADWTELEALAELERVSISSLLGEAIRALLASRRAAA